MGNLHELLVVALHDPRNERLLARKILVERADAHACFRGDPVGAGLVETIRDQNASGCFQQRIDRRTRSCLRGVFPRFRNWLARHFPAAGSAAHVSGVAL
jgi:hypothetical protein